MTRPIPFRFGLSLMAALTAGAAVPAVRAAEPVAIVANPGRFGAIERAAVAEHEVNWWDDDLADDSACTESFAAVEMRRMLARCLGRAESDIALCRPDQIPAVGQVIVIASGETGWLAPTVPAAAPAGFAPEQAESFRIETHAGEGRVITVIKGRDRVGALYGAYAYLESLGLRFYGLGEQGTVWPAAPVALPQKLQLSESPHYFTRGFWAFENRGNPEFFSWMARNRLNFWTVAEGQDNHALKKLGLQLTGGHHNVQFYCLNPKGEYPYRHERFDSPAGKPADPYPVSADYHGDANGDGVLSYFEAHPEWYGLVDGKRSDRIAPEFGDNYCTSNPEATRELTERLIEQCAGGRWSEADILNFWMLDLGKWCACPACVHQGTYTDRLMQTVDSVLKGFAQAQRDGRLKRKLKVVTLAYHETLPAPSQPLPADFDLDHCAVTFFPIQRCYVHPIGDPACTEVNASFLSSFEGWSKGAGRNYRGTLFIGEYYNVSGFKSLPLLFTRVMAADIPWYFRNGARHFHYMHTLTRRWGTWTLNQYLMARLLWRTDLDVDALVDGYFRDCYPTTAAVTRQFYADLERASGNVNAFKHELKMPGGVYVLHNRALNPKAELFPLDHLHYEEHHSLLNDGPDLVEIVELMRRARSEISSALASGAGGAERARLVEDEWRFTYGEKTVEFIERLTKTVLLQRAGDDTGARQTFAAASLLATELRGMTDVVSDAGAHANTEHGLAASQWTKVYEQLDQLYGTR